MNNVIQENIATYIGWEMFLFLTVKSVPCELYSKMSSGFICWMDGACLLSTYCTNRTYFNSKQNFQTCL